MAHVYVRMGNVINELVHGREAGTLLIVVCDTASGSALLRTDSKMDVDSRAPAAPADGECEGRTSKTAERTFCEVSPRQADSNCFNKPGRTCRACVCSSLSMHGAKRRSESP